MQWPRVNIQAAMIEAVQSLGLDSRDIVHAQLHRWLYAGVVHPLGQPYLVDLQHSLICAGDWCLGNDIDSAWPAPTPLPPTSFSRWFESLGRLGWRPM